MLLVFIHIQMCEPAWRFTQEYTPKMAVLVEEQYVRRPNIRFWCRGRYKYISSNEAMQV
jgi:hypothetical protein